MLLFFKGALMENPDGLLIQQTENVQAARQMRFTNLKEIIKYQKHIKACLRNAIHIEQEGKKVELKKTDAFVMVTEFEKALNKDKGTPKGFFIAYSRQTKGLPVVFLFCQTNQNA